MEKTRPRWPCFSTAEQEEGVEFDFYHYSNSIRALPKRTLKLSAKKLKHRLLPYRLTAVQALRAYQKGIPVGHIVHLIRGTKTTNN